VYLKRSDPVFRKWAAASAIIILFLITIIFMLLDFHNPSQKESAHLVNNHMKEMHSGLQ